MIWKAGVSGKIRIHRVNLGATTTDIPVFEKTGPEAGKTVLITAGMDGDEYAGIDAAHALIDRYSEEDIYGRLIIIPIVNIAGFEKEVSFNPLDGAYPKHIAPGNPGGKPTQRLLFWLHTTYAYSSDVWLDMHGGSFAEELIPFFWTWESANAAMNRNAEDLHGRISGHINIHQKKASYAPEHLARNNTLYCIAESGYGGRRDAPSVRRHILWARQVMSLYGLVRDTGRKAQAHPVLHRVHIGRFVRSGMFVPGVRAGAHIGKGEVVGSVWSYDRNKEYLLKSPLGGIVLWCRSGARAEIGKTAFAVGY